MAIQQFNEDVEVISKLGDLPNQDDGLTAEDLKAKFDQASIAIKNFINDVLVPVINELDAARDPEIIYGLDQTLSLAGRAAEAAAVGAALADKFGSGDIIPLANGGTGAATAAAARAALGAAASTHYHSASQINSGTLPVARGGTGGATAEAARKSLGAAGNENLLDNWYFADPVNQRGATQYTAEGFCIDRWSFEQWNPSGQSVELRSGCVAIVSGAAASTNNTTKLRQTIVDPQRLAGKTVTFSAKLKNVTVNGVPRLTLCYGSSKTDMSITSAHANGVVSVTATMPTTLSSVYVAIGSDGNAAGKGNFDIEIESVKLEIGSVSTLANDAPPKKSEQLLECQRYYVRYYNSGSAQFLVGATTGTTVYATLCLPTAMYGSASPTIGHENVNIYPFISGGSVNATSVGGYLTGSRNSCIITASHATTNDLPAKSPATIRLADGGYIEISCEI